MIVYAMREFLIHTREWTRSELAIACRYTVSVRISMSAIQAYYAVPKVDMDQVAKFILQLICSVDGRSWTPEDVEHGMELRILECIQREYGIMMNLKTTTPKIDVMVHNEAKLGVST